MAKRRTRQVCIAEQEATPLRPLDEVVPEAALDGPAADMSPSADEEFSPSTWSEDAAARLEESRKRLRELLEHNPEFARRFNAPPTEDPTDDEVLNRAREGEFGDQVFSERHGAEYTEGIKSQLGG
jgi:hypothetical protein